MSTTTERTTESKTEIVTPRPWAALTRPTKSSGELDRAVAHYPEGIIGEVRWLQGYYLENALANMHNLRAVAAKLGHDKSVEYFYNVINGQYFTSKTSTWKTDGKAWAEFLEMVTVLRRHALASARLGRQPFIRTPTYNAISSFITAKRSPGAVCKIGGIVAPTGGQTSESFKHYRDLNNHGAVIHFEAPASGRLAALQLKACEQYHELGKSTQRATTRESGLRDNVNELRCLIIDNCQVLFDHRRGNDQPCFNWLRELYDDKRPTLILKFTEEFMQDMASASSKGYFEQFIGRMGGLGSILRLPQYAPDADLRAIAAAFRLPESKGSLELLHKWSRSVGRIRIVFEKLQHAQTCAKLDGRERLTLADLQEADEYSPPSMVSVDGGAA